MRGSIDAVRNEEFDSCFESGITGLVGTVSWQLIDNEGAIVYAPSVADIIETPAGSGIYCTVKTAPPVIGAYSIIWSTDGTFDEDSVSIDDLIVHSSQGSIDFGPLLPADVDARSSGLPVPGRRSRTSPPAARSRSARARICSRTPPSRRPRFSSCSRPGSSIPGGERVVRPLTDASAASRSSRAATSSVGDGYDIFWTGSGGRTDSLERSCRTTPSPRSSRSRSTATCCSQTSTASTAGAGSRASEDADGDARHGRTGSARIATTPRTTPSPSATSSARTRRRSGSMAAAQLACEIYKSCPGNEGVGDGDCAIPKNATRVTRTGITIELARSSTTATCAPGTRA